MHCTSKPLYSFPMALISCMIHWVVKRRTCPPSNPAVRSVTSFKLHQNHALLSESYRHVFMHPQVRSHKRLTLPEEAHAQSCCPEQPAKKNHAGRASDALHLCVETAMMNAAPDDCTNLVRLSEAVVYFVKLDCSACMFVLFATHVPYQV